MSQQENIYELPLFKAHVLLLADIVADFSGRTELAEKGKVKELFLRQVKTVALPDAAELQAAAETSTDAVLERALKRKEEQEFEVQLTPQGKVDLYEAEHPNLRPSRKALSRREMLRSLVRGDIHPSDLQTEEELEEELPRRLFRNRLQGDRRWQFRCLLDHCPGRRGIPLFQAPHVALLRQNSGRSKTTPKRWCATKFEKILGFIRGRFPPRCSWSLRLILMFRHWNVCFSPSDGKKKTRTSSSRRPHPGRFSCTQTNIWTTT